MNDTFHIPSIRQHAMHGTWIMHYSPTKESELGHDASFYVEVRRVLAGGGDDRFRFFLSTNDGKVELYDDEACIAERAEIRDQNHWGVTPPAEWFDDNEAANSPAEKVFLANVEEKREEWLGLNITFERARNLYFPGFSCEEAAKDARVRWAALSLIVSPIVSAP